MSAQTSHLFPEIESPASRREVVGSIAATDEGIAPLVSRFVLGAVMIPHALQKLGLFGGAGVAGTYDAFTRHMGVPGVLAGAAILFELLGSFMLVFGVLTRFAAAMILAVMLGAVVTVHWPNGFFMNWMGTQAGEGFEYHLLAMGLAVVSIILGGGMFSVDRVLFKNRVVG